MRVKFDSESQTIEVNGLKMSLAVLEQLANPDPTVLYRFVRLGDVTIVNQICGLSPSIGHA